MNKKIILILSILALSVLLNLARTQLVDIPNENLKAWPAQVIFGLYFTLLTLAIQASWQLRASARNTRQALLLLMLIGDCLGMVLVNIQETNRTIDASYGIVVIWDVATFFVWLKVIELCRPANLSKFQQSYLVIAAPLFAIGREILFLPYKWPGPPPDGEPWLAYLDLLFGDFLVCLWVFIPLSNHEHGRRFNRTESGAIRFLALCVFTGCAYAIVSAFENTVELAWGTFDPNLDKLFTREGIPKPVLNVLQFVAAVCITVVLRYKDPNGLGSHFGIAKTITR